MLPDACDVHVVETAVAASAPVILSYNLHDFPGEALEGLGVVDGEGVGVRVEVELAVGGDNLPGAGVDRNVGGEDVAEAPPLGFHAGGDADDGPQLGPEAPDHLGREDGGGGHAHLIGRRRDDGERRTPAVREGRRAVLRGIVGVAGELVPGLLAREEDLLELRRAQGADDGDVVGHGSGLLGGGCRIVSRMLGRPILILLRDGRASPCVGAGERQIQSRGCACIPWRESEADFFEHAAPAEDHREIVAVLIGHEARRVHLVPSLLALDRQRDLGDEHPRAPAEPGAEHGLQPFDGEPAARANSRRTIDHAAPVSRSATLGRPPARRKIHGLLA
jgi:hypothetical protein